MLPAERFKPLRLRGVVEGVRVLAGTTSWGGFFH